MILMPAIVHYLHPPSVKATPGACEDAVDRLTARGPLPRTLPETDPQPEPEPEPEPEP